MRCPMPDMIIGAIVLLVLGACLPALAALVSRRRARQRRPRAPQGWPDGVAPAATDAIDTAGAVLVSSHVATVDEITEASTDARRAAQLAALKRGRR